MSSEQFEMRELAERRRVTAAGRWVARAAYVGLAVAALWLAVVLVLLNGNS